jgi:hypothetical protein
MTARTAGCGSGGSTRGGSGGGTWRGRTSRPPWRGVNCSYFIGHRPRPSLSLYDPNSHTGVRQCPSEMHLKISLIRYSLCNHLIKYKKNPGWLLRFQGFFPVVYQRHSKQKIGLQLVAETSRAVFVSERTEIKTWDATRLSPVSFHQHSKQS